MNQLLTHFANPQILCSILNSNCTLIKEIDLWIFFPSGYQFNDEAQDDNYDPFSGLLVSKELKKQYNYSIKNYMYYVTEQM